MITYATFITIVIVILFIKGGLGLVGSILGAFAKSPDPTNVLSMGIIGVIDIVLAILFLTLN